MLRFDPGIEATHDFIRNEIGELLALKAWYCDSTHRYTITDAVQPVPRFGARALKPKDDPKTDKARYYMPVSYTHLDVYKRQGQRSAPQWESIGEHFLPQ